MAEPENPKTKAMVLSEEQARQLYSNKGGPEIRRHPIRELHFYEIQEMELISLESLVGKENQALGFTTFTGGVFLSTLITWLSAHSSLSPVATAVYVAITGVAALGCAWSGFNWIRAKKERPKLLKAIRERESG